MRIRPATDADLDTILDIHNDAILNSTALWEDDAVGRGDREAWFAARTSAGDPVIVAVGDGDRVIGYATYAQWRSRYGYRHTVEDTIYIDAEHQGQGIGRALLAQLLDHARAAGHHVMLADIESSNVASIRLHEAFGFEHVGQLNEIGTKFGRWLDLTVMRLQL
jgi:L-amino acid N-acyltransferase